MEALVFVNINIVTLNIKLFNFAIVFAVHIYVHMRFFQISFIGCWMLVGQDPMKSLWYQVFSRSDHFFLILFITIPDHEI